MSGVGWCEGRADDAGAALLLRSHHAGDIEWDGARRWQRPLLRGHAKLPEQALERAWRHHTEDHRAVAVHAVWNDGSVAT